MKSEHLTHSDLNQRVGDKLKAAAEKSGLPVWYAQAVAIEEWSDRVLSADNDNCPHCETERPMVIIAMGLAAFSGALVGFAMGMFM